MGKKAIATPVDEGELAGCDRLVARQRPQVLIAGGSRPDLREQGLPDPGIDPFGADEDRAALDPTAGESDDDFVRVLIEALEVRTPFDDAFRKCRRQALDEVGTADHDRRRRAPPAG